MWLERKNATLGLMAFLAAASVAQAANVDHYQCQSEGARAVCKIQLEGEVSATDHLFLSTVHDRDTLSFRGRPLAGTGTFYGRPFLAGFLPRLYSLEAIRGEHSPLLQLEVQSALGRSAGIPKQAKVKVVDEHFPLVKVLAPFVGRLLSLFFLLALGFSVLSRSRSLAFDGWIYPQEELRWFLGSVAAYLLLRQELSVAMVPGIWPATSHIFAQRIALSVALWSLTLLLVNGRFSDRSCIERSRARASAKAYVSLAHSALLLALALHFAFPRMQERAAIALLLAPLLPLFYAFTKAARELEWKRVFKRSSKSPLLFHLSLFSLPIAGIGAELSAWLGGGSSQLSMEAASWIVLACAGIRLRGGRLLETKSRALARTCRGLLLQHVHGSDRLRALCDFVVDEWGAARISVISVDQENGLVLASAGPEAIPAAHHAEPRRLGPFLRRVCKQEQMLYAPVAEELGKDLQEQGLKHSSLAIPLMQEQHVKVVLCMMADEGERIPPIDAAQLELLTEALSLEILSAAAQHVAESRHTQLLAIARLADGLTVEQLDHWGHFQPSTKLDARVLLGGESAPLGAFNEQLRRSPAFGKMWTAYRNELKALWSAVAAVFEFLAKDNRDDFWLVSPKEFQNPFLQSLGAERVALLLAAALERHTRALAAKPCYYALGYCGVKIVAGTVQLRHSSAQSAAMELDGDDFAAFASLRQQALPGTILFRGDPHALTDSTKNFLCRAKPHTELGEQIFSILSAVADKKEVRRIEAQALEKARVHSRKAA